MKPIRFAILFEPRDLWVGIYWDATWMWNHYDRNENRLAKSERLFMIDLRIFITVIPMLPIRISIDVQRVKAYLSRLLTMRAPDKG